MTSQENSHPVKARSTFFYGYIIIFTLFIIQFFMFSQRSSFGVFFKPLTDDFGWSRALISGAFAVSSIMQGISGVIMGGLNDRVGPRIVITLCGILLGAGLLLMSIINSAWQLYLIYAILVGLGMGGLFTPQMSTVARWFVKRRNLMNGLAMSGGGIGGFIAPPIITSLIYGITWRQTFLVLGIVITAAVIIASQFLKRDPSTVRQVPYGENERRTSSLPSGTIGMTLKEALRTPQFWIGVGTAFCFGFVLTTVMVHTVPHVTDMGISPLVAANILAAFNIAFTIGSIVIGIFADKIGFKRGYNISFILLLAAGLLLLPINNEWLLGLFVIVIAFGCGGLGALQPSLVAELFGMKSHGLILGVIGFAYTLGAALGPYLGGLIFDITNSYQLTFTLCMILGLTGLILTIIIRPVKIREKKLIRVKDQI